MDICRSVTHVYGRRMALQQPRLQAKTSIRVVRVNTSAATPEMQQQVSVSELASQAVRGRFFIPSEEVEQLKEAAGCSMDTLLLSMLEEASQSSRPLISQYQVG